MKEKHLSSEISIAKEVMPAKEEKEKFIHKSKKKEEVWAMDVDNFSKNPEISTKRNFRDSGRR